MCAIKSHVNCLSDASHASKYLKILSPRLIFITQRVEKKNGLGLFWQLRLIIPL